MSLERCSAPLQGEGRQMLQHRSLMISLIAVSITVFGLLGWAAYNMISLLGSYKEDPIQSALRGTEIFLQAVKSHPN
jgi:hypothetical protein